MLRVIAAIVFFVGAVVMVVAAPDAADALKEFPFWLLLGLGFYTLSGSKYERPV